jgi:hypothetical protein
LSGAPFAPTSRQNTLLGFGKPESRVRSARTSLPGARPTPATASSSLKVCSSTRRRKVWKSMQAAELAVLAGSLSFTAVAGSSEPAARPVGQSSGGALGAPVFQAKRMFAACAALPSVGS